MKKITTNEFIKKAIIKHNDFFDYSLVVYTGSQKKITIICPIHGTFNQRACTHLNGSSCPKCANIKSTSSLKETQQQNAHKRRKTKEQFIIEANIVHNNKFNYNQSKYVNIHTPVLIDCPQHGDFSQRPIKHLQGSQCPQCSICDIIERKRVQYADGFNCKAHSIHNEEYDYKNVDYINAHNKIEINCSKHGTFTQTPNSHLNGSGCPQCANMGFFNYTLFENHPQFKDSPAVLYLIKLTFSNTETCYKVGITTRSITERFNTLPSSISYSIIYHQHKSLYRAFCEEQHILTQFKQFNPPIMFEGHTECLQLNENDIKTVCKYLN